MKKPSARFLKLPALLLALSALASAPRAASSALLPPQLPPLSPPVSWARVPLYNELASVNGSVGGAAELSPPLLGYLAGGAFGLVVIEHAQGQGAYIFAALRAAARPLLRGPRGGRG